MVQTYPRLPRVAELIPELKPSIVIMMHRCPMDCQTLVVIDVVKSFAMNKSGKICQLISVANSERSD